MKAKNLMLGDLIQFDKDICVVEEVRIDGTVVLVSLNTGLTSIDGDQVSINEISPIELTTEILEKLGFQKISTNKYVNGKVTIAVFAEEFLVTVKSGNARVMITIKYVHELQHVLRLCGIEKEFEL